MTDGGREGVRERERAPAGRRSGGLRIEEEERIECVVRASWCRGICVCLCARVARMLYSGRITVAVTSCG